MAFDRYAYVLNNPLRYADPTGHWPGPAAYGDPDQDPVIVMLNVNQAQFANGSNQFDVVGYESMTGLCGTVTFAVFYLSQTPESQRSARTVDDVVAQLDEAGIDINYNGAGAIAAMAAEYGWDSLGGNPQIALSTNKETCLQTLIDYMNAGWIPIVRTWSNSSGTLLDNTGQTMTLNDTGESYTNGTGHWVGIVGIAIVNGEVMVRIYNPAQGFAWVSWDFLYDNLTIDWQSVEEIEVDGEKKQVVTVYGHSVIALIRPPCGPDPVLVRPNPRDNKPIPI